MDFKEMFYHIEYYHKELGHSGSGGSHADKMQRVRNSSLALMMELAELVDSTAWKPWRKAEDQLEDIDNACREVVDILFFLVAICEDLNITAAEIEEKFIWVLANNLKRIQESYSKKGGE